MSRIFDALRQSERDKRPGVERWSMLPNALPADPGLAAGDESIAELEPVDSVSDESLLELAPVPETQMPFSALRELARQATHRVEQPPQVREIASHRLPEPSFPSALAQRIASEALAGGDKSPEVTPYVGLNDSQIDLSKLKVVPVASIQSPSVVALNLERDLVAEKFRVLGARLSNIRMGATLKVLHVTSSVVGEGKTFTAVNLAITMAKRFAQKVLLVEGDLRKPAACALLGLENNPGIGEWWQAQDSPVSDYLLRIGDTGLCVLPAGNVAHPASVLQSPKTTEMISELARQFDWVVIDTPPLLPMADSNLWSRVADGTLLVVRKGSVSRSALKKAVDSIDNPKLVGIVLNDDSDFDRVNYYSQYSTVAGEGASAERKVAIR